MTIIMENVQAVKVMSLNIGSFLMLPLKTGNSGFSTWGHLLSALRFRQQM